MKMKLYGLTESGAKLKGYVQIPVFMTTSTGIIIETQAEAYVVPGMTVPILLGEDYQTAYELSTHRSVESGARIRFGSTSFDIPAMGVGRTDDPPRLRKSALGVESFVKAKLHRRDKSRRHKQKLKSQTETRLVRAAHDFRILPHAVKRVEVEGSFTDEREWLVEKLLLSGSKDKAFVVPNTLISSSNPFIPIANTSDTPRFIRKGEMVGEIIDPTTYFDTPQTVEHLNRLLTSASSVAALIASLHPTHATKSQEQQQSNEEVKPPRQSNSEDGDNSIPNPPRQETNPVRESQDSAPFEEQWGPKTSEMPDPTYYPSSAMEDLLDVGELPEHLRDKAWTMLRKNIQAFGYDGRLGHHPAKVHIRTIDGQVPIAVPMYGTSPAKREVIEKQLGQWFEQDVVEKSISPWSAPVVIAYRNGKPRFCVDYRKLNAVTIPDEFPIPRQTEILSSLAGSQVLSSLDALSGFTQLEVHPDHIEKTAFRTHLGLFQFK